MEIVSDLREDTGPVNAVHRRKPVRAVDLGVGEECFDNVLLLLVQYRTI